MTDYYKKYRNYKNKYINLKKKIGGNNNEESSESESREVDWFLFFDLWQVSNDIIDLTDKNDVIILIGDTPSYLISILKLYREVHLFAFSNKPFGCFLPPYGNFEEMSKEYIKAFGIKRDVWSPLKENLELYFNYLDTKTKLTREFITEKWKNIVLVDSSSGSSIHGVSIFFNRYIGNIEQNDEVICKNIKGSEPLQFIRLDDGVHKSTNLDPKIAEKYYSNGWNVINYRSDLIIYIGSTIFYHRGLFMIKDAYERIVPFYGIMSWHEEPEKIDDPIFEKGRRNIFLLEKMVKLYLELKSGKDIKWKDYQELEQIKPNNPSDNRNKFLKFLDDINTQVLTMKYNKYLKIFQR